MLKLSKKVTYSLIALKYMSQKPAGELTSAKEICQRFKTPFDPTSRVLQLMAQQGILQAAQGARGGYLLCRGMESVTLTDLNRIVEGPIQIAGCVKRKERDCHLKATCNVSGAIQNINERIVQTFDEITLKQLLQMS